MKSFQFIGAIKSRYDFKQLKQKFNNFKQRKTSSAKINSTSKINDDSFTRDADVCIIEIYDLGRLEKNIRHFRENRGDKKYFDVDHGPIQYLTTIRNGMSAIKELMNVTKC